MSRRALAAQVDQLRHEVEVLREELHDRTPASDQVQVLPVPPGSILHFHNVDFGDRPLPANEIAETVGHTEFVVVNTEDGKRGAPELVAVWPEGEMAERILALLDQG